MVGGNEQSQNNGTNSINTNPNPLNNSVPNGNSNFDSVSNGLDVNTPGVNTTNNDITSTTVNNNYVSNANDNVSSSVDSNVVDNNMTNNSTNIESNVGSNTNEPVANPGTVMNNGGLNEALTPNDNLAQQGFTFGQNNEKKKKNGKGKIIIGILIIVAIAAIAGFIGYKTYTSSPYNLFKSAINSGYSEFSNMLKIAKENTFEYDLENETIKLNGNVKFDTNIDELKDFTNYTYSFNTGLDVKNKKIELGLGISENSDKLIELLAYVLDNKAYLKSEQLFDRIIYADAEDEIDFDSYVYENDFEVNYDDLDYIVKKVKDYAINSIDKEKLSKESVEITINGEKLKVNSNSYNLDAETMKNTIKSIIDAMLEDKELIEKLVNLSGTTEDEVKSTLEEAKDVDLSTYEDSIINIYTKGFANTIVGFSIYSDGEEVLFYSDYNNITKWELYNVEVNSEEAFTTIECEGDVCNINIGDDSDYLKLKITNENDKKTTIDYDFSFASYDIKVNGTVTFEQVEKTDKKMSAKVDFSVKANIAGEEFTFDVNLDANMEIGAKIGDVNTNNAINAEDLTEEDLQLIIDNLEKALQGTIFYDLIENSLNTTINNSNNEISNAYCDLAFNCKDCVDGQCVCQYYDEDYNLQSIICPDDNFYSYY